MVLHFGLSKYYQKLETITHKFFRNISFTKKKKKKYPTNLISWWLLDKWQVENKNVKQNMVTNNIQFQIIFLYTQHLAG